MVMFPGTDNMFDSNSLTVIGVCLGLFLLWIISHIVPAKQNRKEIAAEMERNKQIMIRSDERRLEREEKHRKRILDLEQELSNFQQKVWFMEFYGPYLTTYNHISWSFTYSGDAFDEEEYLSLLAGGRNIESELATTKMYLEE